MYGTDIRREYMNLKIQFIYIFLLLYTVFFSQAAALIYSTLVQVLANFNLRFIRFHPLLQHGLAGRSGDLRHPCWQGLPCQSRFDCVGMVGTFVGTRNGSIKMKTLTQI